MVSVEHGRASFQMQTHYTLSLNCTVHILSTCIGNNLQTEALLVDLVNLVLTMNLPRINKP